MNNWLKNILFLAINNQCLICLEPTLNAYLLCDDCEKALPCNDHHCLICAATLADNLTEHTMLICGKCQLTPPRYTTSLVPYLYATPLKQAITALKFHSEMSYIPMLAHLFIKAVSKRQRRLPECIIPIPLHLKRMQQRGYNQALELARIIAKQLNIPINLTLCQRTTDTPFQSGLTARQRKDNLNNAFEVVLSHQYKHVAIFDDVVTTGTTANELSRKLKLSGVEIIEVWAIARTVSGKR